MTQPYCMDIETAEGVKPHGFHLGTNRDVAMAFVWEKVRRPEVKSVRLHRPGESDIFDWRDLPDAEIALMGGGGA